ncbi:Transposon TX1 uncharacterized 149 kDa protein [Linum perenne]
MIKLISWNCRGAGHRDFAASFKFIVGQNSPNIFFVFETRISGDRAIQVARSLGFDSYFIVDAVGYVGGIWAFWREHEEQVTVLEHSTQLLHLKCVEGTAALVFISGVYGSPQPLTRTELWEYIRTLHQAISGPWLLCGDFNSIRCMDDRLGGAYFNASRCRAFNNCLDDCELLDLGFSGPKFTWFHGQKKRRLDRAVCNAAWMTAYPGSAVLHLPRIRSDHRPILIHSPPEVTPAVNIRPFRFQIPWLAHGDFQSTLRRFLREGETVNGKLSNLQSRLRQWNRRVFGDIFERKRKLVSRLATLEEQNETFASPCALALVANVRRGLEETLWQEELLWKSKSRNQWQQDGDRNTRFFHLSTLKRRKHNRVLCLKDEEGRWVYDQSRLKVIATSFFQGLYTSDNPYLSGCLANFNPISEEARERLRRLVSRDEVMTCIKMMGPMKSPGKDGFHPIFFQRCWDTVGHDLVLFVQDCFRNPSLVEAANDTLLVLLPKVQAPERISQFRPIGLCNVAYKTVMKCLANRIQGYMKQLIHPTQSSFVPGRHTLQKKWHIASVETKQFSVGRSTIDAKQLTSRFSVG